MKSGQPVRREFELSRVLRTDYRNDVFQQLYFVIPSFDALLRMVSDHNMAAQYEALDGLPDLKD